MVQMQLGVSTDEAFVRLRAKAFALGRTIAAVASDVVERRLRFSWEDE
jgi:AmiR/NasT family two-component response regulator